MDIHQLKQRIDASGRKLITIGNEYVRQKDEVSARKVLVKEYAEQGSLLSRKITNQIDGFIKKTFYKDQSQISD